MRTLIVGLGYGDEGKGRISEYFGRKADWFVRFNGGPNAGHTVYVDGKKHALHHLPAGAVLGKKVALDAGMVIDSNKLNKELLDCGMDLDNLYISESVNLITEKHREQDKDGSGLGTTKSGIAYVYADKALKRGARLSNVSGHMKSPPHYYKGLPPIGPNENVIYESAQGVMLDVDYGCYPFTTSSSVFPSSVHKINKVIGVMKAYTSRVGDGPPYLPEEPRLQQLGQEVGTTTGRKRKCYWLIKDEIDYAISVSNPDEIVVTKLDILRDLDIYIWDSGQRFLIGKLDKYKEWLLNNYPQIKWFSESPDGDLISVGD